MEWIIRTLSLPPRLAPFIEERLFAAGYTQISSERTTGSRRVRLSVYAEPGGLLPSPKDLAAWIAEAEAAGLPGAKLNIEDEPLAEQDWDEGFRRHFAAREVLPGLTVVPPWDMRGPIHRCGEPMPGPEADLALAIEPALAFGTGDHPTTLMCLEMLRGYARERAAAGAGAFDCLDIGSGTGILTLAAKLWGAGRAEGFDIDKRSILNAYLNADLNGLAGQVRFRWGEPEGLGEKQWDIIVCNLFLTPILKYLPRMAKCLKPGGTVILSGFLKEQGEQVSEAAKSRQLKARRSSAFDSWVAQMWGSFNVTISTGGVSSESSASN